MDVTFEVGDAEDLPYPDASFDVVLSTVGVMFCPDQERAVGELLRVCRPGGKIGPPIGRPTASRATCCAPSASTSRLHQA
ncbi:MAG: SAM-dependent methyltransferase [uncultured Rubrobacteraceae bacterium]|uniref:SAM-dependent methyltransferase n=1 Tax=uncultured Rubrobacteraceae bacterium TaxID=349277 RepID=A0A6J4RB87_9ACTN|nr:MAG: SAM-dependent methyltransferase [uncultured Rubrobacteraceae bacterium]